MEEEKVAASAFRAVYDNVKGTAKEQRQQRQDAWNEFETDLKVSKRSKKRKRKQESIVLPADLETACKEGNLPFVKARLDSKSNSILIEAKTMDGHTALHLASLFNHLEILRCILSSSAWLYSTKKIDMTSNTGSTALHYACMGHNADMAHLLLQNEASRTIRNDLGQSSFDLGILELQKEAASKIRQRDLDQKRADLRKKKETLIEFKEERLTSSKEMTQMRQHYLQEWENMVQSKSPLTFEVIAWPSGPEGNMFMFPRSNKKNTEELLNLSRVEQIRWHPDKFQQKFRDRIDPANRDEIATKVKEIAQEANRLHHHYHT